MPITRNQTILITRDVSQSGSLKEILEEAGATVIAVPTIKITDPPDWTSFDSAARDLSRFNWIVFSSINAVKKTADRLSHLDIRLTDQPRLKLAAVGDQTAQAARNLGWNIDLVPSFYQAEGLLEEFRQLELKSQCFWFPRAMAARNKIIKELEQSGAEITVSPVYQNVPPFENRDRLNEVISQGNIDWITFTSSSTVTNFFKILGRTMRQAQLPRLASIGTITTKTLAEYGLTPAFTAHPQNIQGLCDGILSWNV